ncbi:MAG: esterase-like activity of phytase family protein, partial [Candidatus Promineifilaceae bacterium]|nr:esterase-like activity of phytase family protein [Candidatus Promineifilaceae bacterium]
MDARIRSRWIVLVVAVVSLALRAVLAGVSLARPALVEIETGRPEAAGVSEVVAHPASGEQMTVAAIEPLGMVTYTTDFTYQDILVGGLSGVAYDAARDVYYVVSDAKGEEGEGPSRFYTLDIDLGDGSLDEGDVTFLDLTPLRQRGNRLFPEGAADAESIVLPRPGQLFISTEGDMEAIPNVDPFIDRFNVTGRQNRALPIPDKFLSGGAN